MMSLKKGQIAHSQKLRWSIFARKREHGATIVELAILLPVFFLLLFAIFEYTFYLTTQSLLNIAAQRAVSRLAAAPDLDKACTDCSFPNTPSCAAERAACVTRQSEQLTSAKRTALDFLYSTSFITRNPAEKSSSRAYVNPGADYNLATATFDDDPYLDESTTRTSGIDVILPTPQSGETLRAAFQRVPIRVQVRAERETFPLLPFPLEAIRGSTQGWKETSLVQSNPPALDCAGNPITDPNNPNNNRNCRCLSSSDPNQVAITPGSSDCVCVGNMVSDGGGNSTTPVPVGELCHCPVGQSDADNDGSCTCDTECPANQLQNGATCGCSADCPNNGVVVDGHCSVCANSCGPTQHNGYDPNTGECGCIDCEIPGQVQNPQRPFECTCPSAAELSCPENSVVQVTGNQCECVTCTDEFTPNAGGTQCICDPNTFNCSGPTPVQVVTTHECRCTSCEAHFAGTHWDADIQNCTVCAVSDAIDTFGVCHPCENGGERDPANPTRCQCPAGQSPQQLGCLNDQAINSYCGCVGCIVPGKFWQIDGSGACGCDANAGRASCGDTQFFNTATCGCENCPFGQTANAAHTACACTDTAAVAQTCGPHQRVNGQCACQFCPIPSSQIRDPNDPTKCICDAANESSICGPGRHFDQNCSCKCDFQPVCTGGQQPDGQCGCQCPNGTHTQTCIDTGQARCLPNSCQAAGGCACSGTINDE